MLSLSKCYNAFGHDTDTKYRINHKHDEDNMQKSYGSSNFKSWMILQLSTIPD